MDGGEERRMRVLFSSRNFPDQPCILCLAQVTYVWHYILNQRFDQGKDLWFDLMFHLVAAVGFFI